MRENDKLKGYSDNKIVFIKSLTSFSDRMSVLFFLRSSDQARNLRTEDR